MSNVSNASIRFYSVEDNLFSKVVYWLGKLAGYDMQLVHVALEWDGFINEFTWGGISYYQVDEEDFRKPINIVEIEVDRDFLYDRSVLLAYTGIRLHLTSLLKKMLGLRMNADDLLCTDYVQLLLGDSVEHFSATEYFVYLLKKYQASHDN